MKIQLETHSAGFRFLTPGIIGGVDNRNPAAPAELRVPSVRGMFRWWHHAVHGATSMKHLWGDAHQQATASRIAVRLTAGPSFSSISPLAELLPHKPGGGQRPAFPAGPQEYKLELVRLPACADAEEWKRAKDICRLWVLLGGIGTRQNRAAGSVWPLADAPATSEDFEKQCDALLATSKLRCAVLKGQGFRKSEQARSAASDMIGGPMDLRTQLKLERLNSPSGSAPFWRDPSDRRSGKFPRVSSPLKLKVGALGSLYYLIAVWDGRNNTSKQLQDAVTLVLASPSSSKRVIGQLLEPEVFSAKGRGRLVL